MHVAVVVPGRSAAYWAKYMHHSGVDWFSTTSAHDYQKLRGLAIGPQSLNTIFKLDRLAKYDAVHVFAEPFSLLARKVANLRGNGTIVTCRATQNEPRNIPPFYAEVDLVFCNNSDASSHWSERGLAVSYLPNAYPADWGEPIQKVNRCANLRESRLGFIGRLDRHKGVQLLTSPALKKLGSNIKVAGQGPLARQLSRLEWIEMRGLLDSSGVKALLADLDFVVIPSRPQKHYSLQHPHGIFMRESFGHVAIEAMSQGAIPLVPSIGGLNEVVPRDIPRIDPFSANSVLTAIRECCDNLEQLRGKLHSHSQNFTMKKFWTDFRTSLEALNANNKL